MKYIKGKNYQLTEALWVELPFDVHQFHVADGMVHTEVFHGELCLVIEKGWAWDGASFFLFRWFGTPKRWLVPSLYHDALYEPIRKGKIGREYREPIDRMFRDGLIKRGVGKWEAQIAYLCIRVGGNFAVRRGVKEREVS